MPKVQVYLSTEAYEVLKAYRDADKHRNLDEAVNALLINNKGDLK